GLRRGARVVIGVSPATGKIFRPNGPSGAVRPLLPPIPTPGPEDPGPFSLADPARVHRIFEGAGFREVSLTPIDWSVRLAPPGGTGEAGGFVTAFCPLPRGLPQPSAPLPGPGGST